MSFDAIRDNLYEAKNTRERLKREIFLLKEKSKKLSVKKERLLRITDRGSEVIQRISTDEKSLESQIADKERLFYDQIDKVVEAYSKFKAYTDPRKHITELSDGYPILLFPVRLETRFKKIEAGNSTQHQLWVRVFPDDCSVDTFEDTLSETEVSKVRNYWLTVWSAGKSDDENLQPFIEDKKKAAWRGFASALQPGRAYWIIDDKVNKDFQPKNQSDIPKRISEEEVILVIPTEELPPEAEQNAMKDYWSDMYLAGGNAELDKNPFEQLASAVGSENRANELVENYAPFNFNDVRQTSETSPSIKVVFIHFSKIDDVETKQSSWSQPAKVTTLPDRFVLLGYKGMDENGNPIQILREIDEERNERPGILGEPIPDPLIIGPNPSLDINEVLKNAFVEDFTKLPTEELKIKKLAECYEDSRKSIKKALTKEEFITEFRMLPTERANVGLESVFDNLRDEIKAVKYVEYLAQKSETKWLYDFDEAVNVGMGFKVGLSQEAYENGFDRLFVLGVRSSLDNKQTKTALEELIKHHHYGTSGFSIMPQGMPTNNTEDENSGYSENEDIEEAFERYISKTQEEAPSDDIFKKTDGQWLGELLGIDANKASLNLAANYSQTDQCEAKAMNQALWNATIGYFMEGLMTPVFKEGDQEVVRYFFSQYVSGRGNIPAIRIGDQPYGILTTSSVKNLTCFEGDTCFPIEEDSMLPVIKKMYQLFVSVSKDWNQLLEEVAYVGKKGDAHQILLDVIGLHASSVEFYQRYSESFAHLYNQLNFHQFDVVLPNIVSFFQRLFKFVVRERTRTRTIKETIQEQSDWISLLSKNYLDGEYKKQGMVLLKELGYSPEEQDELIPILEKFFFTNTNQLKGDLIDDQPLSEKRPIRPYTSPMSSNGSEPEEKNYISWLKHYASEDHDKIKNQQGFREIENEDGTKRIDKPNTLLYEMLRHALELEFSNTAISLYQRAGIIDSFEEAQKAKIDADFVGIQEGDENLTKYDYLDSKEARITGATDITVAQHISTLLKNGLSSSDPSHLKKIVDALDLLQDVPTARLERAFVEHLDVCSYRLDAWLLGFVNMQLERMRYLMGKDEGRNYKSGLYLGAYGWVENLKPDNKVLKAVELNTELKTLFDANNEGNIVTDSSNEGYIHTPSINQATTAAVLRSAYKSNANADTPEVYKVNLSSERVRMAQSIIEGMQQGQSLGSLLGYQFERGLHDRYEEAEVDTFIYALRRAFPLKANRLMETSKDEKELGSITQIEARNVIDGLALVKHIKESKKKNYPFGKNLKRATRNQKKAINAEVDRLLNINDAIADLATAESVHQIVQANYDRAASNLDTYSKGNFPPIPEVVRTPRSGVGITHRIGIHFKTDPSEIQESPRAQAEPAINEFLKNLLPPLADIWCKVVYRLPSYEEDNPNPYQKVEISLDKLGLAPIDLIYLLDAEDEKSLTALDDYILKWIHKDLQESGSTISPQPRPDVELEIRYTESIPDKISVFEIMPLVRSLRSLILAARPLKSSDMHLPNEESKSNNGDNYVEIDRNRFIDDSDDPPSKGAFVEFKKNFINPDDVDEGIDLVKDPDDFTGLIIDGDFESTMDNKPKIIEGIDKYIDLFVNRLHSLSQFGIQQAGFGFIYARKAKIYGAIYKKVLAYKKRWEEKQDKYTGLITDLGNALTDAEKMETLQKAERMISTSYTIPLPDTVEEYKVIIETKKASFDHKLAEIEAWLGSSFTQFKELISEVDKLRTGVDSTTGEALAKFDLLTIEMEDDERQIIVLAEDLKIQATKLNDAIKKKAKVIQDLLDVHETEANPMKRVNLLTKVAKLLFGEDFKIIPKFELSTEHHSELKKAYVDEQLLEYQRTELSVDFPVDDWLYGIARVREKMGEWENVVMLSECFEEITLDLKPLQLPYQDNDTWLALSFPETYEIESDKLLYTAYFSESDLAKTQCGLLIDEWTEVIPAKMETTGLSFQYDQPNTEPPQTMLLVTPSKFTGSIAKSGEYQNGEWQWENLANSLHETLDLAKLRAIEPKHIDKTAYSQFLPATISAVTAYPFISMTLNYAVNNSLTVQLNEDENG